MPRAPGAGCAPSRRRPSHRADGRYNGSNRPLGIAQRRRRPNGSMNCVPSFGHPKAPRRASPVWVAFLTARRPADRGPSCIGAGNAAGRDRRAHSPPSGELKGVIGEGDRHVGRMRRRSPPARTTSRNDRRNRPSRRFPRRCAARCRAARSKTTPSTPATRMRTKCVHDGANVIARIADIDRHGDQSGPAIGVMDRSRTFSPRWVRCDTGQSSEHGVVRAIRPNGRTMRIRQEPTKTRRPLTSWHLHP